jgi:hypothetical protein
MNEFIKPKETVVSDKEYIERLVNASLRKDLHENEEVCEVCHGTGMVIVNNSYGLSDDPDKTIGVFPYKHQSISFCQHCYNGVVRRCQYCGMILPRGRLKCSCDTQQRIDFKAIEEKEAKALREAPIATEEVLNLSEYYYSDKFGDNEGYFDNWDEFFDYWFDNHDEDDEKPEFVWTTIPENISMDAMSIIESATEDLYEDAYSDISDSEIKKLQDYLDDWCKNCGVGTTYYQGKYKVRIPWELANR